MMKKQTSPILAATLVLSVFSAPIAIAQTSYESWENPDDPIAQSNTTEAADERLESFVDQLNTLLTQAEKDKAASPLFLRDLRDLVSGYEASSSNLVLHEDFSDGDFTRNPVWVVGSGRYFIEKGWGVRNALDKAKVSSGGSGDPAVDLLATILGKALGGNTTSSSSASTQKFQPTSIFSNVAIANAFTIKLSLSSWVKEGRLVMGPYQGTKRNTGYRLIYNIGGSIDLVVKSATGARTIDTARGPFRLEDKKVHGLEWTRDTDGNMAVSLDGRQLFQVRDVSFRDPFRGFGMATRGGDFIVKSVDIYAGP